MVYRSKDDAIISQKWRLEDQIINVSNDYPVTILTFDTKFLLIRKCVELSKEEFIQEVNRIMASKKGGSK